MLWSYFKTCEDIHGTILKFLKKVGSKSSHSVASRFSCLYICPCQKVMVDIFEWLYYRYFPIFKCVQCASIIFIMIKTHY